MHTCIALEALHRLPQDHPAALTAAAMAPSRTTAKTHVFANDDLKQVLHSSAGNGADFTKTKRELRMLPEPVPLLPARLSGGCGGEARCALGPRAGSEATIAAPVRPLHLPSLQWSSPSAPPAAMWTCCASCWRRAPPARASTSRCAQARCGGGVC